jgi:hypothetical protein
MSRADMEQLELRQFSGTTCCDEAVRQEVLKRMQNGDAVNVYLALKAAQARAMHLMPEVRGIVLPLIQDAVDAIRGFYTR